MVWNRGSREWLEIEKFESVYDSRRCAPQHAREAGGRPMSKITSTDMDGIMTGDLSMIAEVACAPHVDVERAWQVSKQHALTTSAVRHVLRQLLDQTADPLTVRQWASFVMRGYLEVVGPPIRPVDIEYEDPYEDEIVEALHYLDQIGDLIDGDVEPDRVRQLLATLEP